MPRGLDALSFRRHAGRSRRPQPIFASSARRGRSAPRTLLSGGALAAAAAGALALATGRVTAGAGLLAAAFVAALTAARPGRR